MFAFRLTPDHTPLNYRCRLRSIISLDTFPLHLYFASTLCFHTMELDPTLKLLEFKIMYLTNKMD